MDKNGCLVMTDRELMATALDPRLVLSPHLLGWQREKARLLLSVEYVLFGMAQFDWMRRKESEMIVVSDSSPQKPAPAAPDTTPASVDDFTPAEDDALGDQEVDMVLGLPTMWGMEAPPVPGALPEPLTAAEVRAEHEVFLTAEFYKVFGNWVTLAGAIDWRKYDPEDELPSTGLISPMQLLDIDVPALMKDIMARDDVGLLPVMATSSEGQIGALLAESFCEGMYSRTQNPAP